MNATDTGARPGALERLAGLGAVAYVIRFVGRSIPPPAVRAPAWRPGNEKAPPRGGAQVESG